MRSACPIYVICVTQPPESAEITLSLSPDAAKKLSRNKGLKLRLKGRGRQHHLITTYFDTPHHVLRKSGIALRVRDDGKQRVQAIDAGTGVQGDAPDPRKLTSVIDGDRPVVARIPDPELSRALRRRRCADRLESVFTTEVDRTTWQLEAGGAEIHLAVDRGVLRVDSNGHSREEPICEAELALLSGDPTGMMNLALQVCETFDATLFHQTRAERGYALARPALRPRSCKATLVSVTPDLTVGESFRLIVSGALDHLFANHVPVLRGDPGGVHQSRVAMRRLRAALRAFKGVLPYDKRKAFNGELRWFQQRLSPARDWHVFLDETLPLIARSQPKSEAHVDKLRRVAREERRRATLEAVEYLESRRYARMILKLRSWIASLENEIPRRELERPVTPFAKSVLRKTQRDLVRESRPLVRLPVEDVHTLRKSGKKARYATEFFSPLWTGEDIKPYLKMMARLQDKLGSSNDAVVARQILWSVRPGRLGPETIRLVQDWSDARFRESIRTAQSHWRRLRKARPFWE